MKTLTKRAREIQQVTAVGLDSALAQALDEWQASVEERLETLAAQPDRIGMQALANRTTSLIERLLAIEAGGARVPIFDPGPSKYDREPESEPE